MTVHYPGSVTKRFPRKTEALIIEYSFLPFKFASTAFGMVLALSSAKYLYYYEKQN